VIPTTALSMALTVGDREPAGEPPLFQPQPVVQ